MATIIATNSCHRQQLIRASDTDNLQLMVVNTKDDFASRLNKACDGSEPPVILGRGRRAELRRRVAKQGLEVSGESVRKWLSGESIPSMDNLRFIAVALNVTADWLLTGRPPMRGTPVSKNTAQQDRDIYSVEKTQTVAFTKDEQTIIEGFRVADSKDREQILWLANRALDVFGKRSEKQ